MHLARPVATLLALAFTVVALSAAPASAFVDRDCSDFATQWDAQTFFVAAGPGDPHQLDSDGDGLACESLPCPCADPATFVGTPTPTPTTTPVPTPTVAPTPIPTATPTPEPTHTARHRWARIVRVTDGDTVVVRFTGRREHPVRIIGIDTPEVYGKKECGGAGASRHMTRMAPVGARVRLTDDPSQADRDRYDRLLRYVTRKGRDLGLAQIKAGWAEAYVYDDVPFARTASYQRAQERASTRLRGMWSSCR